MNEAKTIRVIVETEDSKHGFAISTDDIDPKELADYIAEKLIEKYKLTKSEFTRKYKHPLTYE